MEAIDGRSLAEMLTAGALAWPLAVLICAQVVAAAHRASTKVATEGSKTSRMRGGGWLSYASGWRGSG